MGRRSVWSADVLITEVLFIVISFLDDLFAGVLFIVVSFVDVIVDVLVAKVMVNRNLRRASSGARSSSSRGGFERVHFSARVARWHLWHVVLTGEQSGGLISAIHYRRTGKVPLATRRRIVASFVRGRVDVVRVESS